MNLNHQLSQGLAALGLPLVPEQQAQLLAYLSLLEKWNKVYNLTAIRDPQEMLTKHILDSLAVVPFLDSTGLIDVGTGAGLPGIPLAIACPQMPVTLLDSNGKKTRFVQQVVTQLRLNNARVFKGRVEEFSGQVFPQVISRAFSSLKDLLCWTAQLGDASTRYLAMKGQYPSEEIAALPKGFYLSAAHPMIVPGEEGQRCLVVVKKHG
jgi:16S rRNA (guanine(527)-N(7))-methyltransferase RsmG